MEAKERVIIALNEAKKIASKSSSEMIEFARQRCPGLLNDQESYVFIIGYLHGCVKLALDKLAGNTQVGDLVKVDWSNGAGYSVYRVVDPPGPGIHQFQLVEDKEFGG